MKELSVKEKAKCYEEVVNKLKRFMAQGVDPLITRADVQDFFPELKESKESEDERIRKELIFYFQKEIPQCSIQEHANKMKEFIAWLEKQGEQTLDNSAKTCKDEPKFKVGDWIVYKENIYQIHNIGLKKYYDCLRTDGTVHTFDFEYIDSKSHLWTIQDARDGDMLFISSTASHETFIFKNIDEKGNAKCYFAYDSEDGFREGKYHFIGSAINCKPATKEQRDLLFQKMKDAGYDWDAEKKELKKIEQNPADEVGNYDHKEVLQTIINEQKPVWSEEDEEMLKSIEYHLDCDNSNIQCHLWLRDLKDRVLTQPKQEWSEDDAKHFLRCLGYVEAYVEPRRDDVRWFKSLKDRVQPQPKQEWSKEDERMLDIILNDINYAQKNFSSSKLTPYIRKIDWLKSLRPQNNITDEELAQAKKEAYNDALDKIEYHSGEPTFDDGWGAAIWYLKNRNAQPQNTWKPSEEQIKVLQELCKYSEVANLTTKGVEILKSMYNDIKKLTVE